VLAPFQKCFQGQRDQREHRRLELAPPPENLPPPA